MLDHGHHDRAHAHCVQNADGADDEDEWREDEWVPHHSKNVIVGKVRQQDVHEHRRASASEVVMLSECFFQAALHFLLKSVPHLIEFELTKKLVIDECWRSRRISCSLLEDLVSSWCATGGAEALRISLRGTLRKHANLIIIDLDVFESWDNDEHRVARLLAELLDRVLLEGNPVSLRTLLVILELLLKPARQI